MLADRPTERGPGRRMVTRAATKRSRLKIGTDIQTSFFFMLNCLLHSRLHTGIESNSDYYDEDVNVYLAQLLNAQIDPKYLAEAAKHITACDADLFRVVAKRCDPRRAYTLYKTNADFILIGASIFDLFEGHQYGLAPSLRTPKHAYVGKAAAYYELASSYATRLGPAMLAAAAVLHKLSMGIDGYLKILSYMRGQYLDFIRRYTPGELFHLELAIREVEMEEAIDRRTDEFLETYHEWLRTGVDDLKTKLAEQAREIKQLDPTFHFNLPP